MDLPPPPLALAPPLLTTVLWFFDRSLFAQRLSIPPPTTSKLLTLELAQLLFCLPSWAVFPESGDPRSLPLFALAPPALTTVLWFLDRSLFVHRLENRASVASTAVPPREPQLLFCLPS